MNLNQSHGILLVLLTAVILSSGCIENSSTGLSSDIEFNREDINLNSLSHDIYQNSMQRIKNISDYDVKSDDRMAMNLPGVSISVNMNSEEILNLFMK